MKVMLQVLDLRRGLQRIGVAALLGPTPGADYRKRDWGRAYEDVAQLWHRCQRAEHKVRQLEHSVRIAADLMLSGQHDRALALLQNRRKLEGQ